jgi:N-acetylglutamate synthase-like GNAT family acetyltransferase
MSQVRRVRPEEHALARELYRRVGYGGGVRDEDVLLGAFEGDRLIGVVRLVEEGEVLTLRGMMVDAESRGRGVGGRLLDALLPEIGARTCWCVPYRHLEAFYARAGFYEAEAEAPAFLVERAHRYRKRSDVCVMVRAVGPR